MAARRGGGEARNQGEGGEAGSGKCGTAVIR